MPQTKIGAARFELATSRPPAVRATKLRHTPSVPMNTGTSYIMQFFLKFVKPESAQTPAFMVTVLGLCVRELTHFVRYGPDAV